jgi:hypothetical protein
MSIAQPTKIADAKTVQNGPNALIDDVAHGRGANEKSVIVVMQTAVIFIPQADKFRGVSRKEKILHVHIAKHDLLVAFVKGV